MRKSFQGKKYRIEQHSKGDLVEVWKAGKLVDGVAADVDVPLVKGQMKTLIADGGIEFYSGEMFIEWDLRELEIPPTGEYQHYRHKLQPAGVKKE